MNIEEEADDKLNEGMDLEDPKDLWKDQVEDDCKIEQLDNAKVLKAYDEYCELQFEEGFDPELDGKFRKLSYVEFKRYIFLNYYDKYVKKDK